jgi:DNA-binding XRE family transcriptional regulator
MLPDMLKRDRERWGMGVGEAGWRLGMKRRDYVAIEDGERPPSSNQNEAICEFFGWPGARRRTQVQSR